MHVADSLGMEVSIASSPGWSHTGGPWVEEKDAMKKLVWKEVTVEGGKSYRDSIPAPFDVSGPYLNGGGESMGVEWASGEMPRHYEDVAVVAVRLPEGSEDLQSRIKAIRTTGGAVSTDKLSDHDLISGLKIPYKDETAFLEYEFDEPVSVSSIVYGGGSVTATTTLFADDTPVAVIPTSGIAEQSITFAPVMAKRWKVAVRHWPANPIYALLNLKWDAAHVNITEFRLYSTPRIHLAEAKAGFSAVEGLGRMQTPSLEGPYAEDAIVLTDAYKDGILNWNIPEGKWKIYRFGWSLTGKMNHPAPPEATGLEVDKLDPEAWKRYFTHYLDMYKDVLGGDLGPIQYVLTDSYESGCETWTPAMASEFKARRGYDLLPWLPVLTGEIIGSPRESERFLSDWRQTLGELVAENFDRLSEIAHSYGLKGRYSESHEGTYALVADGMDIKRSAEVPMAAIWATGAFSATAEPTGIADIRESASVSHIYGQKAVAAESMTAVGIHNQAYAFWPGNLKRVADLEFSAGVNRIIIHESAHQPLDDSFPGQSLSVTGQWFNRHETWAEQARPWTDYLARTSYLLQQGRNVSDILLYYGDGTCVVVRYGSAEPVLPKGYNYDFVNTTALLEEISWEDGLFTARRTGASWKVLAIDADVIPDSVKDRIERWKAQGACICELKDISMEGIAPDVETDAAVRFVHRSIPDGEIYWVSCPAGGPATLSFRSNAASVSVWNPETGEILQVPSRLEGGRTVVEWSMDPDDAKFFVLSKRPVGKPAAAQQGGVTIALDGPWTVRFQEGRGAPAEATFPQLRSYTESEDSGIKYFSGTAVYTRDFELEVKPSALLLDLGSVKNIAEVIVNGRSVRTLWKVPYKVDITEAVKPGANTLEVRVTNLWPNRLIRDAQLPENQRITYTAYPFYKGDEPLRESGLIGPVKLTLRK